MYGKRGDARLTKPKLEISLYLVTDSTDRDMKSFCALVEQALQGGVTLVQLREKSATSREFYQRALRLKDRPASGSADYQ